MVRWRATDSNQWQERFGPIDTTAIDSAGRFRCSTPEGCTLVLRGIRVDDWVFGVSSVSKDGWESPVAGAVPGGAFKPFVPPAPTAQ
jgi:hypothetical protein